MIKIFQQLLVSFHHLFPLPDNLINHYKHIIIRVINNFDYLEIDEFKPFFNK